MIIWSLIMLYKAIILCSPHHWCPAYITFIGLECLYLSVCECWLTIVECYSLILKSCFLKYTEVAHSFAFTQGVDKAKDWQMQEYWKLATFPQCWPLCPGIYDVCWFRLKLEIHWSQIFIQPFFFPLLNLASSHFHRFYWHNFITISFAQ